MNVNDLKNTLLRQVRARPIWTAAAGVVLLVLLVVLAIGPAAEDSKPTYFAVKRGDFLISIVEGGNLEALREVVVRNEVEGTARIIYIVPEGTYVKEGDLLVELDSAQAQDQVNQQEINNEKAEFALIQAEQQLDIQKSVVDSDVQAAELTVEFAQKDLDKYLKGESQQERRNLEIAITNVQETLQIADESLHWSEELYKQGFETKGNLDRDRLSVSQNQLKLEQARTALEMFEQFDYPKKKRQLEAALEEAQDNLARVKLQGERRMAQAQADVDTQKSTLDLNQSKLNRDKQQLVATKIYAPKDGLVVYSVGGGRFGSDSLIEEGATVRNRQELIKLPDVSAMKVNVKIHESYVNQVKPGQQAFVVLDSMPDKRFAAVVDSVGLLPDTQSRWANPNLKVYSTQVRVLDKLPDVKPGVSARAEIVITNIPDTLTVPIQAVTTLGGKQVVYLDGSPPKPAPVTVGMYNTKMIQVISGLEEGDRVLLAPPSDMHEEDLGGSIITKGEELPPQTNVPPASVSPTEARPPDAGFAAQEGGAGRQSRRGGSMDGQGGRTGSRGGGGFAFNREEMMKQFDKDGDGQLSDEERAAMREQFGGGRGGGGGMPGFNREEMMKQFDKDGDGQLSDEERAAMREQFGGGRRGRTNGPPSGF